MIGMRTVLRATLVAATLGAASLAALPAQAQGIGFSFGFGVGDADRGDRIFPRRLCLLTDRDLREAIRDQGYRNIYLNVPIGRTVQARATRGDWVYLLRVNICTGDIVSRERLRRS